MELGVCPCESMPENRWLLPSGEWVTGCADIGAWGLGRAPELAAQDAERYNALGCVAWVIRCPECAQVYAMGVGAPH